MRIIFEMGVIGYSDIETIVIWGVTPLVVCKYVWRIEIFLVTELEIESE